MRIDAKYNPCQLYRPRMVDLLAENMAISILIVVPCNRLQPGRTLFCTYFITRTPLPAASFQKIPRKHNELAYVCYYHMVLRTSYYPKVRNVSLHMSSNRPHTSTNINQQFTTILLSGQRFFCTCQIGYTSADCMLPKNTT